MTVGKSPRRSALAFAGPYHLLLLMALLLLGFLTVSRSVLMAWLWQRVEPAGSLPWLLLQGLRADLILVGLLVAVPVLLAPVLALTRWGPLWRTFTLAWAAVALALVVLLELSTPSFIVQYDVRPNRLYFEYLKYPKELFATLWNGFRVSLLLGSALTGVLVWLGVRLLRQTAAAGQAWSNRTLWLTWPLVLLLVFACVRSTVSHRPANPALFAITPDALVNSLIISSGYSVLYAAYSLKNEAHSTEIYGELPTDEMLQLALDWPWLQSYEFRSAELPTLHRQRASVRRNKPLNIVIVLQESLGATFVQSLGGLPVTPELEKLKTQGIWLDQLYATGTRSVRGIEAVTASFAPTPAQSVVKLSNAQRNFTTIASVLKQAGYHTQFIYGGEAHFDNMRAFFTGNGFSQIVDIDDMHSPVFVGSWGASDEDLFTTAHQQLTALHDSGKPFFSLIFTSSNHAPFEFPDGRIALYEQPKQTVNNAVKYADWAMGRFFAQAMQSPYWQDTLFLVVADHDSRVYGSNLIPVEKFRIPGLILGADVKAEHWDVLASQIDLAPTLLSLAGVDGCHPMIGRDLSVTREVPGRALLQFDDYFALMQPDAQNSQLQQLTILKPDGSAAHASYQRAGQVLTLASNDVPLQEKQRALAQGALASFLYREGRYRADAVCTN